MPSARWDVAGAFQFLTCCHSVKGNQ